MRRGAVLATGLPEPKAPAVTPAENGRGASGDDVLQPVRMIVDVVEPVTRTELSELPSRQHSDDILVVPMELKAIALEIPTNGNIVVGQAHFIKTVEDIYEAIVNTVPQMKFGVAFCEASGPCLIRVDGNDEELKALATRNAEAIGAGHTFVVAMRDGYPINVLGRIKDVPEVCNLFCATANPVQVIVAENQQGRGILGVIDGAAPKGVESADDAAARASFLRKIGYKR